MPALVIKDRRFPVRAALFDMDGTLMDCGSLWLPVTRQQLGLAVARLRAEPDAAAALVEGDEVIMPRLLAALGVSADASLDPRGPLTLGTIPHLANLVAGRLYQQGVPWDLAEPAVREALEGPVSDEQLARGMTPLGDVPALLARMHGAGLLVAVVTNNPTALAVQAMEVLGVASDFDGIFGSDLVRAGKPAPDLGLYACQALGVLPAEAAMVGDGLTDVAMARQAGIALAVGVAAGGWARELLEKHADVTVGSVDEMDAAA